MGEDHHGAIGNVGDDLQPPGGIIDGHDAILQGQVVQSDTSLSRAEKAAVLPDSARPCGAAIEEKKIVQLKRQPRLPF
jgi:hypothetical protein